MALTIRQVLPCPWPALHHILSFNHKESYGDFRPATGEIVMVWLIYCYVLSVPWEKLSLFAHLIKYPPNQMVGVLILYYGNKHLLTDWCAWICITWFVFYPVGLTLSYRVQWWSSSWMFSPSQRWLSWQLPMTTSYPMTLNMTLVISTKTFQWVHSHILTNFNPKIILYFNWDIQTETSFQNVGK